MKLVGDITYLPTDEGWLYPATWLDLAAREIVGYSMAAAHGQLKSGCIVHSDRGREYTSDELRCETGR